MRRRALLAMLLGSVAATASCAVAPTERQPRQGGDGWWDGDRDDGGRWEWTDRGRRRPRWRDGDEDAWRRARRRRRRRRRERTEEREEEREQERPERPAQQPDPPRERPAARPRTYPRCGLRPNNPYDCERRSR